MNAALTYIFKNKRYKKIQSSYNTAISKYKVALGVWMEHESLSLTEDFEFKTHIAEKISVIQTIDSWIKTYDKTQTNCKSGLLWFFIEKGQTTIPHPKYNEYQLVSENFSYINTLQGYINIYNQLLESSREAVDRFLNSSSRNHSYGEIKKIASNERRILIIADVLKKAHTCENKFKSAWKIFANGRSFDNIPLQELGNINEDDFHTKNIFLYFYNKTPKLISLILGKNLLPVDSFSDEAIAQERETYLILCSKDGELPQIDYIEPFHVDVHLEPGKELKRAILDSISYGERCNFVDTYSISKFYTLRRDFDVIGVFFDDAVGKVKDNISAVKAYNKDRGNEAAVFIEDYLRASTEGAALYNYIETYKQEKNKRDNAKRIKRSYPKGFLDIFGDLNLDICSLSYVINVIELESRVKIKHKELEEAERKRIEAERKKQEEGQKNQEIRDLKACVSSWPQPTNSYVNCFSLYYYYPVNCYWDASPEEWDVRNLIWDFKANPNRPSCEFEIRIRHERAVNEILPELQRVINHYFGSKKTKLTLVCIPSSKRIVTERRYKDLSERLCRATGMTNGYHYVNVISEGEAHHLGGTEQAQYSIDRSYFKGRYVILFDDVITSGNSMKRFKRLLESAGAIVIGGLSIGKTKHERQGINPIDKI